MAYIEQDVAALLDAVVSLQLRVDALFAIVKERLPPPPPDVLFASNWINSPTDGGWSVQEFAPGRATLVAGRDGRKAVRLHTKAGDALYGVNLDRCDMRLSNDASDAREGREWWLAHSVQFPSDFVDQPESQLGGTWYWGSVFNFHDDADSGGSQGPAQLMMYPRTAISPDRPKGLHYQIFGGDPANPIKREYPVGPITRGPWYDFVIHVRWSSRGDGFYRVWLNGKRVFQDNGPNLYIGRGAYLKIANYHEAHGKASSVIHDRVIRGKTAASVSLGPLE